MFGILTFWSNAVEGLVGFFSLSPGIFFLLSFAGYGYCIIITPILSLLEAAQIHSDYASISSWCYRCHFFCEQDAIQRTDGPAAMRILL
jgi:hypothetical protein